MGDNPKLVVLSEGLRGQQYELMEDNYMIGRGDDCGVSIQDPTVSSAHCELLRNEDGSYTARDTGSTNGTRINGVRITEQKLNSTDILQVGGVEILYDLESDYTRSTKTVVNFDVQKINPNRVQSLDPTHKQGLNTNDPRVRLAFRLIITLLVIVVVILMIILVNMVMTKGS